MQRNIQMNVKDCPFTNTNKYERNMNMYLQSYHMETLENEDKDMSVKS